MTVFSSTRGIIDSIPTNERFVLITDQTKQAYLYFPKDNIYISLNIDLVISGIMKVE
jgi:hypothetical protein